VMEAAAAALGLIQSIPTAALIAAAEETVLWWWLLWTVGSVVLATALRRRRGTHIRSGKLLYQVWSLPACWQIN
jgi:hypothetical protein